MTAEQTRLVEDNVNLVYYYARKYAMSSKTLYDELCSAGSYGLCKAAVKFNPSLGHLFAAFAGRCIVNEMFMAMRQERKHANAYSYDLPVGDGITALDTFPAAELNPCEQYLKNESSRELQEAVNALPEQQRVVIRLVYGLDGHPARLQKEVSEALNVSQSYVSRIERKALESLSCKKELKKHRAKAGRRQGEDGKKAGRKRRVRH